MKKPLALIISLTLSFGAGVIGSYFTVGSVELWYPTLTKPFLNPPSWVFGPVWSILYTFMGIAAWRVYLKRDTPGVCFTLKVYGAHLLLNAFWSIAFFGMQDLLLALVTILILLVCIFYLIVRFIKFDKPAGYLLVPYALWVAFATYLNFGILLLN